MRSRPAAGTKRMRGSAVLWFERPSGEIEAVVVIAVLQVSGFEGKERGRIQRPTL